MFNTNLGRLAAASECMAGRKIFNCAKKNGSIPQCFVLCLTVTLLNKSEVAII